MAILQDMRCESGSVRGATGEGVELSTEVVAARAKALELFALAARGASPPQILKVFHPTDQARARRLAHKALHPDKFATLGAEDQKLVDIALTLFTTAVHAHSNPHDTGFELTFKNARAAAAKSFAWASAHVAAMAPAPSALAIRSDARSLAGAPLTEQIARSALDNPPPQPVIRSNASNAQAAAAAYASVMNAGRRSEPRINVWV